MLAHFKEFPDHRNKNCMDPVGRSWISIVEKNFKTSKKQINNCMRINQKTLLHRCGCRHSHYTNLERIKRL